MPTNQKSIQKLRNLATNSVKKISVELNAKHERLIKEKEDLLAQCEEEKEDVLSQFEKAKEDLVSQFKKEKENLLSKLNNKNIELSIVEKEKKKLKLALTQNEPAITSSDLEEVSRILEKKKKWPEEVDIGELGVGISSDYVPKVFDGDSSELYGKEVEMLGARSKSKKGMVFCTNYTVQYCGEMFVDALLVIAEERKDEHFAQEGDSGSLVLWNQDGQSKVAIMDKLERTIGNRKSIVVVWLDNCFRAIPNHYDDVSDLTLCGYWNGVEIKPFIDL